MRLQLARRLESVWYAPGHPMRWVLAPLELVYRLSYLAVRACYRVGLKRVRRLPVPVVVVGNVTVGGTGKTPLVIWLARELARRGYRVGCISRGYGGRARTWPQRVRGDSDPSLVGDEPVLIARATGCAVGVGPDRVAAARLLLSDGNLDVLLADDGLQHHALPRAFEIAVVDGRRGLGNGACLPAGPLREPASRLDRVDAVVVNEGPWGPASVFRMRAVPVSVRSLADGTTRRLDEFRGGSVHAVAGIGDPERFFRLLEAAKIRIIPHAFPDHARLRARDLEFDDDYPILMTEKDAVKCREFADRRCWSVTIGLEFEQGGGERLLRRVVRDL